MTQTAIQIDPIPAFADNYLWLVHNSQNAIIVDPGDAGPVQAFLDQYRLTLCGILITHHHADHIGGVEALLHSRDGTIPVYGPEADRRSARIPFITHGCVDQQVIRLESLDLSMTVMEVPGHTSTHIAYHAPTLAALFCGDTLFAGGCGRLFEGTPQQMLHSLGRIAALDPNTEIYCAHEYTLANLRFASALEPDNPVLQARLQQASTDRANQRATVPSSLSLELATNPFLRCTSPALVRSLQSHGKLAGATDEVSVFTAARLWKNSF